MRTLILGYADADALTPAVKGDGSHPRFFTETEFEKAKSLQQFPEGVQQLKAFRLEEYDNAIFLGAAVTALLESNARREADLATARSAAAREQAVTVQPLAEARAKVQAAASHRNELMGKLHNAKSRLSAHDATPETLRGKSHDKAVLELQRMILGDPEKKITGLESEVAEAVKVYDAAAAEFDALQPKPKTSQINLE